MLLPVEDAGLVQDAEVLGDVLLAGAERIGELTDRSRATAELFEQPDLRDAGVATLGFTTPGTPRPPCC